MRQPRIQLHRLTGGHHILLFSDIETARNWIKVFKLATDDYTLDTAPNGFPRIIIPESKWKVSYSATILHNEGQ